MYNDHFLSFYGRNKKLLYLFLCLIIIFQMVIVSISPVHGDSNKKTKTVKIGYFYSKSYQEGTNDSEQKSGLGYEYMQQIANYAGWKYKYVYGSWQDIYKKLLKGEVDVMSDISYTKERSKQMLFPTLPFTRENYYLYVPKNKAKNYKSTKALKGKTVSVTKGLLQNDQLVEWNKKHKAGLVIKYYNSATERIKAYATGRTDMTLGISLGILEGRSDVPLRYISSSNVYVAVSKKRPDLLEDVNQAVATLTTTIPRIDSSLAEKYSSNSIAMMQLSVDEINWFNKHHTIDVGYLEGSAPFSYTNSNGKPTGTYVDLLKYTFKHFRLNNKLKYHAYKNVSSMLKALENKTIDISVPCVGNAWRSEKMGILQSINMNSTAISVITKKNKKSIHTFAVTNQTPIKGDYIGKYYKNYKTVFYNDIHACLKAVRSGEADATILNAYQISIYLHSDDGLCTKRLDQPLEMTLAVGSGNQYLLDLVNRGIVIWSQQNISESLMRHTDDVQEITFGDFIKNHYIGALAIVALLVAFITIPITGWIHTRRRRLLAEKAANNDLLTGLYSRRAYDEDLDHIAQRNYSQKDYMVIVMDANGLKKVNDHLGHRAGDEMLCGVAQCIKDTMQQYNCTGKAYRTGGDEFVIIICETKENFEAFYQSLLQHVHTWHGQLVDHITVSSGYVLSTDYPQLSVREIASKADERMYHEKQEQKEENEHNQSRDEDEIYKRLLQLYKADIDPLTQLPGSIYFYNTEPQIRKEVESRGIRLVVMAITFYPIEMNKLKDLSHYFIRMFGKENLSSFNDCYYVMTSEVQLEERLEELYKHVSSLSKEVSIGMSVGAYVIDQDDSKSIKEICYRVKEIAHQDNLDYHLHIHYDHKP